MRILERLALVLIIVLLTIGCDQGTKALAEQHLAGRAPMSFLGDTVRLQHSENPGSLLGLGAQLPEPARFWLFTAFTATVLIVTLVIVLQNGDLPRAQMAGLSLVLGGGVGNLIDRVLNDGLVIDFLNLGVANIRTGIFNVADVAVFGGVGLFLLYQFLQRETPAAESLPKCGD